VPVSALLQALPGPDQVQGHGSRPLEGGEGKAPLVGDASLRVPQTRLKQVVPLDGDVGNLALKHLLRLVPGQAGGGPGGVRVLVLGGERSPERANGHKKHQKAHSAPPCASEYSPTQAFLGSSAR
jgi:hypothetical protein